MASEGRVRAPVGAALGPVGPSLPRPAAMVRECSARTNIDVRHHLRIGLGYDVALPEAADVCYVLKGDRCPDVLRRIIAYT